MSEESLSDTNNEIDDIKDDIEYLKSDIKEIKSSIEEIKDQINDLNDIYASKFKRLKESVSTPTPVPAPTPPVEKKKSVLYFFLVSKYTPKEKADKKKLYLKINIAQMTSLLRPCYKSELENKFYYKEGIENVETLYQDLRNFLYFTKKVNKDEIEMLNKKITLLKTSENEFTALLDEFFNERNLSK